MLGSNDEGLRLAQYSGQKVMSGAHLANEFLLRVNRWIDVAAETFLRLRNGRHDLAE